MFVALCLFAFACAKSREAYVLSASSSDMALAPGYIYGCLSVIGSIRKHDSFRDIIVLVDPVTLLVYPQTAALFSYTNVSTVINTAHRPLE